MCGSVLIACQSSFRRAVCTRLQQLRNLPPTHPLRSPPARVGFPAGYEAQPPQREAQMRSVALGLLLPALRDCIGEWRREVEIEYRDRDLNRVRRMPRGAAAFDRVVLHCVVAYTCRIHAVACTRLGVCAQPGAAYMSPIGTAAAVHACWSRHSARDTSTQRRCRTTRPWRGTASAARAAAPTSPTCTAPARTPRAAATFACAAAPSSAPSRADPAPRCSVPTLRAAALRPSSCGACCPTRIRRR